MDTVGGSVSRGSDGTLHITLNNRDPNREQPVTIEIRGAKPSGVTCRMLAGEKMNSHNTSSSPESVVIVPSDKVKIVDDQVSITLPPISVVALQVSCSAS